MSNVTHGGMQAAELEALGLDPVDILDLSANLNPLGPHSHVLLAARDADVRRYPSPDAASLRDAIARTANLGPEQVVVTAGATAALYLAARAVLAPGYACAIWPPTFGEYTTAITAAGGQPVEYRAQPPEFTLPLDITPATVGILCNPNNPTGVYLERNDVEGLLQRLQGTLLIDVAYDAFVEGAWDADDLVRAGLPVVVVHSMTKLHATPGLRVGYAVGPADVIERMAALQASWPVGSSALAAGYAMLAVDVVQRRVLPDVTRVRAKLTDALRSAGLEVVPGRANFILVRVGEAAGFRARLLRCGFAVRDCTSFGLPEWVRVAVPVEVAADRLAPAFLASLEEGSAS
jgi:histidinol-phosphate/aromatic aminotransferase/cobyric acid decarboxylase-like protein